RGHIAAMFNAAQQSASAGPEDFLLMHELGVLSLSAFNYADAQNAFKNALAKCPNDAIDNLYLAIADAASGDLRGAGAAAQAYAQKHPDQRIAQSFVTWMQSAPAPPPPAQPPGQPPPTKPVDSGF